YMSPEQARGYKVDARTDIFSLGATLYELVTGVKPFTGRTPTEILSAILKREPAPVAGYKPDEPPGIQSVLNRALRKDRNERYATMTEMISDLREMKNEIAFQSLQRRSSSSLAGPAAESEIIPLRRAGNDGGAISSNTSWPDHLSGKQIGARITGEVDAASAPAPRRTNDPVMLLAQETAKAPADVVKREPPGEAANPAGSASRDKVLQRPSRYWPAPVLSPSWPRRRANRRRRNATIAIAAAGALLMDQLKVWLRL
ncbi:MAG: serine/threonine-protein kinase, partial [Blastocatellia bacterium]